MKRLLLLGLLLLGVAAMAQPVSLVGFRVSTPVSSTNDALWSSVTFLLKTPTSNGSTSITDATGLNTITVNNASASTAITRFSLATTTFNGTNARLVIPHTTSQNLGSSDFTIEGWIYPTSVSGNRVVMTKGFQSGVAFGPYLVFQVGTSLNFYATSTGSSWDIASGQVIGTVAVNTWYHFAVVRSGSTWTTYLNATQGSTWTSSSSIYSTSVNTVIGADNASGAYFAGNVYQIRITKSARTISIPTGPFPEG